MIPLLDILQSIPVLSFLPGVMLAMVALFPRHQIGVELGAILLIFTGQVWNMAFSFYSSLKSIPRDMREAAKIYRFNWYQRFTQFELPYAAIGLVWNSMMSVAGGWFFLMACEMFVLGSQRLSPARTRLLSADRGQRRRYRSDPVGRRHHDRRDRAARPDCLAAGHCVGREVQVRAGGEHRRAAVLVPRSAAEARDCWSSLRKRVFNPLRERAERCISRATSTPSRKKLLPATWKVWVGRTIAVARRAGASSTRWCAPWAC